MNNFKFKKSILTVIFILFLIIGITKCDLFSNNFYEDINDIDNPDDILVLVNKNNKLNSDFIPTDLMLLNRTISNENKYLRKEALVAIENLITDATSLGYRLVIVSAYRDYEYQKNLYNNYVETRGKVYADDCCARPGHSEHQTGLSLDIMGSNNDYNLFEESIEFEWMKNNAHKYGFILRYPKNKYKITGFKYEPWHYRFVGVDAAYYIYYTDKTLEEYLKR